MEALCSIERVGTQVNLSSARAPRCWSERRDAREELVDVRVGTVPAFALALHAGRLEPREAAVGAELHPVAFALAAGLNAHLERAETVPVFLFRGRHADNGEPAL